MNKKLLILLLFCGLILSFVLHVYSLRINDKFIEKITHSVFVNVEISPQFADSIKIVKNLFGFGDTILHGMPTNSELNKNDKTIRFFGGKNNSGYGYPFIKSLSLKIPLENHENILKSIDNISIFMGNKNFYFSSSDLLNLSQNSPNKIKLLNIKNANNFMGFINWKGNDIFIINSIFAMLKNPFNFVFTYIFLIVLFIVLKKDILIFLSRVSSRNKVIITLSAIMLFGFLIRFVGLSQIPFSNDDLYSLIRASNPQNPFLTTFGDPGNPPLYYILLKFWLFIFGFSEFAARMFSVFLGTIAIATAYFGLKNFSDKKAALFAALLTAFFGYQIGQLQEIRGYVLVIMLIPLCVSTFLKFVQNPHSLKFMVLTLIPCAMMVNTHYYGAILVFVFGIYFAAKIFKNKNFSYKNIKFLLIFSVIILLSFMPYFFITSINKAIADEQFNSWIRKPGLVFSLLALIFPLLAVSYLYARKLLFKILLKNEITLLNFIIFTIVIGYEIIFVISMFRPILTERYLIFGLPLFIAAVSILVSGLLRNKKTSTSGILLGYAVIIFTLNTEPDFRETPYKQSFFYIKQDTINHKYKFSILQIVDVADYNEFLKLINENEFAIYDKNENYDVIYVPLRPFQKDYYRFFEEKEFSYENTHIIRISEKDILYKKYK